MKEYLNKNITTIKVLLFPLLMVLVLNPIEVYYSNITDFTFTLKDFIFSLILIAVALLIVGSLVLSLIPRKIYEKIICIIFSGSLMLYLQNMFLNRKLSNPDGSPMRWNEVKTYTTVNLITWIVLLIVILALTIFVTVKKNGFRYLSNLAAIFAVLQLVGIVSCIFQIYATGLNGDEYHVNGSDQYSVAPNNNVLVMIIDGASAKGFTELCEQDSSISEDFKDFTFYNNYESDFSGTYPQVLHMVTGNPIDVKYTRMENAANAWNSERSRTFYDRLHDKGYTCNLYVQGWHYEFGEASPMIGSIDNINIAKRTITRRLMDAMMIKYSLYRCLPYIMKPRFEVNTEFFRDAAYYDDQIASDNLSFYRRLKEEKMAINESWDNAFVLDHIQGVHYPYDHDANLEPVAESSYEEMYKGAILIMKEYLEQLKELGVYDDATIFIMADHANQIEGAVYLLKTPGETHDKLVVNHSPIDAMDFQATVLSLVGADYSDYGTTIFDWKEDDQRERVRSTITKDDYYFNMYSHTYTGDAMSLGDGTVYDKEYIGLK